MPTHTAFAVTVREAVDVLRQLEPALWIAWPTASTVDERGLEQRVRRLEKRGVMQPVRTGSGPRDQYLFDETGIVSARLYLRLLEAGVRLSRARRFVDATQGRIREAVEQGKDLIAWMEPNGLQAVMSADDFARIVPSRQFPRITAVSLRELALGVRKALREIRRQRPTILADGKPATVVTALKQKHSRAPRRKSRKESRR